MQWHLNLEHNFDLFWSQVWHQRRVCVPGYACSLCCPFWQYLCPIFVQSRASQILALFHVMISLQVTACVCRFWLNSAMSAYQTPLWNASKKSQGCLLVSSKRHTCNSGIHANCQWHDAFWQQTIPSAICAVMFNIRPLLTCSICTYSRMPLLLPPCCQHAMHV